MIPAGSGWILVRATDINDAGQITGFGFLNGNRRAFMLDLLSAGGDVPALNSRGVLLFFLCAFGAFAFFSSGRARPNV
jgi:hypothetical protein